MKNLGLSIVGALALASGAMADPLLQLDLNGFDYRVAGNSVFGVNYTGSINITRGSGELAGIAILPMGIGSTPSLQQASNSALSTFNGTLNFVNGVMSSGNLFIELANGNRYTTNIVGGAQIATFVGGGFIVQALTGSGAFNGNSFGGVNITQWNSGSGSLPGSFLQFRVNPNVNSTADMDLFVDVIPLPPAAWTGLATLGGVIAVRRLRRR